MKARTFLPCLFLAAGLLSCSKNEKGPTAVTSITLDKSEIALQPGQTASLNATVFPENVGDKTIVWDSSNPEVASVDSVGTVTALGEGDATITARSGECKAECAVKVTIERILAESASITPSEIAIYTGESATLQLEYRPCPVTEAIVWTSSDSSVATVDSTGSVSAVAKGTVLITARFAESGVKARATVTVIEGMRLIGLDSGEIRTADYSIVRIDRKDTICVARGEVADFQINVSAFEALDDVHAEIEYFCRDTTRPSIELEPRVYWTGKVYCSRYWNEWQGGFPWNELTPRDRLFPDILIPVEDKPLSINKDDNNSFWLDFDIPRNFADGLYYGRLRISALSGEKEFSATRDFNIRVYPVTLPEEQSLLVINWHGGSYAQMNDGSWSSGTEPDYQWNMRGKTIEFMNDYGQNGWTTMQRTATGPAASLKDGKIVFDFTNWLWEVDFNDRHCRDLKLLEGYCFCGYNDYWNEHGPEEMIVRQVWYVNEKGELTNDNLPATDPRTHDHLVNLFSQLSDILHSYTLRNGRKLIDVYVQSIMDEPYDRHAEGYEMVAAAIKEGCPDIKILEPSEAPSINENLLDYPCPNLDRLASDYEKYKARAPQKQWLYTCLRPQGNVANRLFGQRPLSTRLIHWCNYRYNAIGFLHWGLNQWDSFEWYDRCYPTDAYNLSTPDSPGGDHFIIYPGPMTPYPSVRVSNMRDGIRDYELLKMVEARSEAKAREFCYKVVYEEPVSYNPSAKGVTARWKYYDENIDHFRQTRREILEYLSE